MFDWQKPTGRSAGDNVADIGALASYMPEQPVASSYALNLGWKSISANIYTMRPGSITLPGVLDVRLNVQLSSMPSKVTRSISRTRETSIRRLDSIAFIPPLHKVTWKWDHEISIIQIQLFQSFLTDLESKEGWQTKLIASLDTFNIYDPMISEIGHFLANILLGKARIPKPDYVDMLAKMLVRHLLEFHTNGFRIGTPQNDSHTDKAWPLVRAARFIREHLHEDITIDDMAKIANLSPYYFTKIFKNKFGSSPHQYLLTVRLAHAEKLLCETALPLSGIVEQCGFASQSHFTNIFHKTKGITPRQFRTNQSSAKIKCNLPDKTAR
jgi:AraC family transcriptional regulator